MYAGFSMQRESSSKGTSVDFDHTPLCKDIKDEDIKSVLRLLLRRWSSATSWNNPLWVSEHCKFMVNHGLNHIENVFGYASRLYYVIKRKGRDFLKDDKDKLRLILSIWLHDWGHAVLAHTRPDDFSELSEFLRNEGGYKPELKEVEIDDTWVRKNHSLISCFNIQYRYKLIDQRQLMDEVKELKKLRDDVADLCCYHPTSTPLTRKQRESKKYEIKIRSLEERNSSLLGLCALLRILDSCDETWYRVADDFWEYEKWLNDLRANEAIGKIDSVLHGQKKDDLAQKLIGTMESGKIEEASEICESIRTEDDTLAEILKENVKEYQKHSSALLEHGESKGCIWDVFFGFKDNETIEIILFPFGFRYRLTETKRKFLEETVIERINREIEDSRDCLMKELGFSFAVRLANPEDDPENLGIPESFEVWQTALTQITPETLQEAETDGQKCLQSLREYRSFYEDGKIGNEEYLEQCNAESFISDLPKWRYLYMEEYGAFPRLEKENQILADMEENVQRLDKKRKGSLLHIVSGDPACGKSTLVKLVLQRLIEKRDLEGFPYISEVLPRICVFEIIEKSDLRLLEKAVSMALHQTPLENEPLYIMYFHEDLFGLEKEKINELMKIFERVSSDSSIYFLTTSPSWMFSRGDLAELRRKPGFIYTIATKIEGIDDADRKSLKEQHQKLYGKTYKPELLKLIDSEENLGLIKLALHQDLTYSEYLRSLFDKLETRQPKFLAVLLLSSTLAKFYVHLPITLIQGLNKDLPLEDRLPDDVYYYYNVNEKGLRLFKIRTGTRNEAKPTGLPDTIAPFHDRVAQVIYETWPINKDVPIFKCKLSELKDKVHLKLSESRETRPILANVFRGQLCQPQKVSNKELSNFVYGFGPVRQDRVTLRPFALDEPDATYRWIIHSKYDMKRAKEFREYWERAFSKAAREEKRTKAYLLLFLLNPNKMYAEDWIWIQRIPELNENSFSILLAVLEELLIQTPIHYEILAQYLYQLEKWSAEHPPAELSQISYRYRLILALLCEGLRSLGIPVKKSLNNVLGRIIKEYITNIDKEYLRSSLTAEISHLATQIDFLPDDSKEISTYLSNHLKRDKSQPALFELLLRLIPTAETEDITEEGIINLYWEICIENSGFYGLSHTSVDLFKYLNRLNEKDHSRFHQMIERMFNSLIEGKLDEFTLTFAYPDFLSRFLESTNLLQHKITSEQVLNLLRPLLANFYDHFETRFVFREAKILIQNDPYFSFPDIKNNIDRQIRLCLASELNLSLEVVMKDFTELLEREELVIPTYLCKTLLDYLKTREGGEIPPTLEDYKKRIFSWLERNSEKKEAGSVLNLLGTSVLFPSNLEGCEKTLEHALRMRVVPFQFMEKWMKERASKVLKEQRYSILDLYWGYLLKSSDRIKTCASFLCLLEWYGPNQDPIWWSHAVQELLRFYDRSICSSLKPKRVKWRGERKGIHIILYKQRDCLDKVMDAILDSLASLETNLRDDSVERVAECLEQYKNQLWALRWILRLNPEAEIDGSKIFLDYLGSLKEQPTGIQSYVILDQTRWWFEWIEISKREISEDLAKIWLWLNQVHPPASSTFVASALFKVCPKNLRHSNCGELLGNILRKVKEADLDSKSKILFGYLKWLKSFNMEEEKALFEREIANLKGIFGWFLQEVDAHINTAGAVYGLQSVLQGAYEYKIDLDQMKVENVFFKILEEQIEHEVGGALSKHYFVWLIRQNKQIDIRPYLQWIEKHYQKSQTPWVLRNLIRSARGNAESTVNEIGQILDILRLLIADRSDRKATIAAIKEFVKFFTQHQAKLFNDKNKLNEMSEDIIGCYEKINLGNLERACEILGEKAYILNELQRYDEATKCCDEILSMDCRYSSAWSTKVYASLHIIIKETRPIGEMTLDIPATIFRAALDNVREKGKFMKIVRKSIVSWLKNVIFDQNIVNSKEELRLLLEELERAFGNWLSLSLDEVRNECVANDRYRECENRVKVDRIFD